MRSFILKQDGNVGKKLVDIADVADVYTIYGRVCISLPHDRQPSCQAGCIG